MGSWGVGIFSNDTGADVREDFRALICEGLSAEVATQRLRDEYGVGSGGADDNEFWLGLAAIQHRVGHVAPGVIDRALRIVEDPAELERWDGKHHARRRAVLEALRTQLLLPPPAPKRLRAKTKVTTSLEAGQHVVFDVPGVGPVLLRVETFMEDKGGRYPCVIAVRWDGRESSLARADRLPFIQDPDAQRHPPSSRRALEGEALGFTLTSADPRDVRVLPLRVGPQTPRPKWTSGWVTPWEGLARWFVDSSTVKRPWAPSGS